MESASSSSPAIEIQGLHHSFREHRALSGVSFEVSSGSIHGFVGPNGAGKTTTLKILATLLPPQTGTVRVCGLDVVRDRRAVRATIGFMPDDFSMYRKMRVEEYLDFFAAAYGCAWKDRRRIIDDVLELTDMGGRRYDLIHALSRGMQQRLSLARVLVNDPRLLLLDEPASGLDPRARLELMAILRALRDMGKTIFISSHILAELADLCDSVSIIDRGQIRYSGDMRSLLKESGDEVTYRLELESADARVEGALLALEGVLGVEEESGTPVYLVRFDRSRIRIADLLQGLLVLEVEIVGFQEEQKHLGEVFLDLTEPGVWS